MERPKNLDVKPTVLGGMPEPTVRPTYATIMQWHWSLPTDPKHIAGIVDQVEATLQKLPFDTWAMSDFVIAVSELIQNPFLHAPTHTETHVEVSVLYVPTVGVFVGVSDVLGPVPPEVFSTDLQTMDRMAEHGRGFPIMRTFSSLLFYNPHGEWKEIILGLSAA